MDNDDAEKNKITDSDVSQIWCQIVMIISEI